MNGLWVVVLVLGELCEVGFDGRERRERGEGGPVRMSTMVRVGIRGCSSVPIRSEKLPQEQSPSKNSLGTISPTWRRR